MGRRLVLSVVFVLAGFVGGVAVTMRTAADSRAAAVEKQPEASTAASPSSTSTPSSTASPSSNIEQRLPGAVATVAAGGPDFTRVAGQAVKGVANISSLQIVRGRPSPFNNDPFFR